MANEPNEEEISISGPTPPASSSTTGKPVAENTQDAEDPVNKIGVQISDLTGLATPGQTNDEFLAKLLQTPPEQLIPWEDCWLPSKGIYYGWPDGMIRVRAMGQTADKILANQRLAQSGQSIDMLFQDCCQFPIGFDASDLLLGDRIFLLYFLRGITHGEKYEFAITCPNQACRAVSTHSYNLMELAQTITWAKPELGNEPFKVVLPYLSKATGREVWVSVRFLRAKDANDILARRKAKDKYVVRPGAGPRTRGRGSRQAVDPREQAQQNLALDDTLNQNMEKIIVNVMGVGDMFQVRRFIEGMHAQDTAAVREWLRDNTPGIDNTISVTCPECTQEFVAELPITDSFFRPSKQ